MGSAGTRLAAVAKRSSFFLLVLVGRVSLKFRVLLGQVRVLAAYEPHARKAARDRPLFFCFFLVVALRKTILKRMWGTMDQIGAGFRWIR